MNALRTVALCILAITCNITSNASQQPIEIMHALNIQAPQNQEMNEAQPQLSPRSIQRNERIQVCCPIACCAGIALIMGALYWTNNWQSSESAETPIPARNNTMLYRPPTYGTDITQAHAPYQEQAKSYNNLIQRKKSYKSKQ